METRQLRAVVDGGVVRCAPAENGRQVSVVTTIDGEAFTEAWLAGLRLTGRALGQLWAR